MFYDAVVIFAEGWFKGGMPFIPAGGAYPVDEKNGKKLYLLIQINFAGMLLFDGKP